MTRESWAQADGEGDPAAVDNRLRIRLFGTPDVSFRGQPVMLARRQTRALLFRIAASAQAVAREALFALLWPDVPESQARRNLTVLLNHLRRELPIPNLIEASDGAVSLHRDAIWTDVATLNVMLGTALERRSVRDLENGLALLRGPFLQGFSLAASPDYDAWLAQEREAWQRHMLDVLSALTDAHTARRDYAPAIAAARRYLELDALAENMHRRLMGLYAASGDRPAALRQFDACVEALERDLDVSPLPETWALWESIRAGTVEQMESASPSRRPHARSSSLRANLPAPPNPFIGRERDLAEACALLQQPGVRLVTLIGAGGCGKTRLALAVASSLRDAGAFADGVVFVPLAGLRDPAQVLDEIARACGLREQPQRALAQALRDHLGDGRTLLVLDNVEHLLPASAEIAALLAFAPQLHVLATSRATLHLVGEHLLHVQPLPLPDLEAPVDIEAMKTQPALALLLARARAHSPAFRITSRNASDLAAICARLDGLPLAIELAAARLKLLSPHALLEKLDAQHALLINGPSDLPERHQTLRATLDWSYDLLDDAQRMLAQLSVFAGGWTFDAAEAACAQAGAEPHAVLRDLDALVDNSLVERTQTQRGTIRFRMLTTIQAYALERLRARGAHAEGAAIQAHLDYFRDLVERAAPYVRNVNQARWLEQLDDERANVLAALETAIEIDAGVAVRMAGALGDYWLVRGALSEGRRYLSRALALPTIDDIAARVERARALQAAGSLAVIQGDYATAQAQVHEAVGIWRALDRKPELAQALLLLSGASGLNGDGPTAAKAFAEGHQLAVALADPEALAIVHLTNGRDSRNSGDYALASRLLRTCIAHWRRRGDAIMLLIVLLEAIPATLATEGARAAIAQANEALALARRLRNDPAVALALNNLGESARFEGHADRAAVCYARALQVLDATGNLNDVPRLWHNQACIALQRGQFVQAQMLFVQSLDRFQELQMERGVAECLAGLARLAVAEGQPARAVTLWGAAEVAREHNGWGVWPADGAEDARYLEGARAACDAARFNSAWQTGRGLTLQEAIDLGHSPRSGLSIQ
jgi:predicted ATPase/DNA-binding SARP family transcriptional activator